MANKLLTAFQRLDSAINGQWDTAHNVKTHNNTYQITPSDKTIYKAKDKIDYAQKKLELQQNAYLKDKWLRTNRDLTLQAFSGLNNLKLMYRDADLMDAFPEIGAALTIVAEESTCLNQKGQIVNVFSKSDRVKTILEDLLVNRLDIQMTAPMIIRGMCKYGNQFMYLNIDKKNGILGWRQLPVYNVERLENGIVNPYGSQGLVVGNAQQTNNEDTSTQFVWVGEQNQPSNFRNWQIGHFRLLTDSLFWPYGCLVGDSRIETEYGYKEIDQIEVGDKVWTFNVETQERELSEVTMHMNKGDKMVYEVKTQHNYIEGTSDHKLLCVVDNKFVYKEIKDITINDFLVISSEKKECIDIKIDKSPIPSSRNRGIQWFDKNIHLIPEYVNEEIAELFGFIIGDGSLTYGRILSLAGGVQDILNDKYQSLVEKYSNTNGKRYYRNDGSLRSIVFHSKFFGEMLKRLGYVCGYANKRIPQWVFNAKDNIKKAFIKGLINADGYMFVDSRRKNTNIRYSIELENEQLIKDLRILIQSLGWKCGHVFSRQRQSHYSKKIGRIMNFTSKSFMLSFYETLNTQHKCNDISNRLSDSFILEKVKSIKCVGVKETYDITVDNNNSNFFANGIVTHNCSYLNSARRHWRMLSLMEDMMLIYRLERSIERRVYKIFVGNIDDADVQAYVEEIANNFKRTPIVDPQTGQLDLRKNLMDVSQDIFIPTRDPNAPTPIDTLSAAQNLTAMDDIKFIQNKVFTALGIPKTFLNFEEAAGDGKNLALMDIRFTRKINRVQQAFLMELTKIASIHLYLLGFEDEITNFTLSMNNPSTQAEQLEIDNLQKKIGAIRDAVSDPGNGIPIMSLTRALKEIMKWSDKEIKENLEEIRLEKGLAAELEKTTQIIKKTGVFDTVDRIYGEPGAEYQEGGQQEAEGGDMGGGGPMGGGGGMPPMDDGGLDGLGMPGGEEEGDISGAEGEMPMDEIPQGDGGNEPPMESAKSKKPLILENTSKLFNDYLNKIDENGKKQRIIERPAIFDKALLINEEFDAMIKQLDDINL